MSYAVIRSNSNSNSASTGLTTSFANLTNPAATSATISVSRLVPNLVDILLSLALLTSMVLYSLNLGSSAYLLLIYISYFPSLFFYGEITLLFLTYLAILRILYRPIKK